MSRRVRSVLALDWQHRPFHSNYEYRASEWSLPYQGCSEPRREAHRLCDSAALGPGKIDYRAIDQCQAGQHQQCLAVSCQP